MKPLTFILITLTLITLITLTPLSQLLDNLKANITQAQKDVQDAELLFQKADDLVTANPNDTNQARFAIAIKRKTNIQNHFNIT
jgi:hypothetical protein